MESARANLTAFIAGSVLEDIPPAALFTVNLQDEDAIKRRIVELKSFADHPELGMPQLSRTVISCLGDNAEYTDTVGRLRDNEQAVNTLRLQFLGLSAEQRTGLLNAQEEARRHENVVQQLEQERSDALAQQQLAERSIEVAQQQAKDALTSDLRELASQRALIEKVRQEHRRCEDTFRNPY